MATPFMGELRTFGFGIVPKGWAACNGQLMAINTNQPLFSLLGTQYGGDGIRTFGLPDLRGRMVLGTGTNYPTGQIGGEENHVLQQTEMPAHTHPMIGSSANATLGVSVASSIPAATTAATYATTANATLGAGSATTGSSQSHPNQPPYLTINYCIALTGIFPTRS